MRILVVVNPSAGSRPSAEALAAAVGALRAEGHEALVLESHVAGYGFDAVREQASELDRIVACGGDGTVSEVARAILAAGSRATLVVAPAGTGNDLAGALGIDAPPEELVRLAGGGRVHRIDVGLADDEPFLNATSAGVWAELSASVAPESKAVLGPISYVAAGLAHLGSLRPFAGKLTGQAGVVEGDFLYLAICNGPTVGGGSRVAPAALLDDGELDAVALPALPAAELVGAVRALRAGEEHEALVRLRSAAFRLEADEEVALTCDGEPMRKKEVRFEVLPRALAVLVPEPRTDKSVDEVGVVP